MSSWLAPRSAGSSWCGSSFSQTHGPYEALPRNRKVEDFCFAGQRSEAVKRDRIFLNPEKGIRPFEFNAEVAEVFDDILQRTMPFSLEQQAMMRSLCKK